MKLSILIAAYNVDEFIEKCIRSCDDQQLTKDYEIIVVNDGSKDNTLKIAQDLQKYLPNLRIIDKPNEGLGAARNTALQVASGTYVWMIDGDDYLPSNTVSTIINHLDSNYDCYGINYNLVQEDETLIRTKYPVNYIDKVFSGSAFYNQYYKDSYTWQFIFKREIIINNDLRFQERINMQDSEIFPKIMHHTKNVAYIDVIAYNYVQQSNSFTNTTNGLKRIKYFQSIIKVKESLKDFGNTIKDKDNLLYHGILKKENTLDEIIFNHLVFFKYSKETLMEIIELLKKHNLYPLSYQAKGKWKLLKLGLNTNPVLTKRVIDFLRK